LLPAIERYISERIILVNQLAEKSGAEFKILSGKFGLLKADDKIPWYDHLLKMEEVEEMSKKVESQIKSFDEIIFFTCKSDYVEPYLETMVRASSHAKVKFTLIEKETFSNLLR